MAVAGLLGGFAATDPASAQDRPGPGSDWRSLPDGTYVGHTTPGDDLISYRLQVTVAHHRITAADFWELWDGFDYSAASDTYIQQWIIDPARRAAYLAAAPTYLARMDAATAYDTALVGHTGPDRLPPPAGDPSVHRALLEAWKNVLQLRLRLNQHVNQTLGDNGDAPHTWNEYIPPAVTKNPRKPVPLVLSLHGSGNSIVKAEGLGFPFLGAQQDFVTLVPDDSNNGNTYGNDGSWNVAPAPGGTQLSDVDFLLALIKHEEATQPIDPHRIYLTGISNGAAMSSYLAMLHPTMFAGVAAFAGGVGSTGGSFNATFLSQIQAVLANNPAPGLPVVLGSGDEDQINWRSPVRGQGPDSTAAPGYQTQVAWWKTYNGLASNTWDPRYPWGQPLQHNRTLTKYTFTIHTGQLPAAGRGPAPMSFYLVNQMFHDDPNPYADILSWDFLKHFSRSSTGTLKWQ
ncbi:PHB depolymerase family esterase [Actinoplanes sp. NPDC051411]|uniref:alpha/beta hydrolase family esterase n=1 Tax=Actinoplanes sp. NPDC051411 TaxID=3155522 RepID=UPI0034229EA0